MFSGKKIAKEITEMVASERRNPVLADLFARMNFMERRGSGLKKITDKTNKLFDDGRNHVEFDSDSDFFKVTIYNANYNVNESNDNLQGQNGTVNGTVNKTEKMILELLLSDSNLTVADLIQKTGKAERTVKRGLASLKEKGLIERVGSDKTGYWKVL